MKILAAIADGTVTPSATSPRGDAIMPGAVELPAAGSARLSHTVTIFRLGGDSMPIGLARLSLEGDNLWAEIDDETAAKFRGLVPCIGGVVEKAVIREDGVKELHRIRVLEISLCSHNADPRIPPIA